MFDSLGYANDKQIFEDKIVPRTPNTKTKNKVISFMLEACHINYWLSEVDYQNLSFELTSMHRAVAFV